jgi:RHS repeat-associated protein
LQSFSYDDDGNLSSDGMWDYNYDAENRLYRMATTTLAAGAGLTNRVLEFRYDYLNRRVQKVVTTWNGTTWTPTSGRRYLYTGWNLVAEFEAPGGTSLGALARSYTWGLDLIGSLSSSGGVGALVQIHDYALSKTLLPTYDGNGNVASLLNADTGGLEAAYEYDPSGNLLRAEGAYAKENPFRFSTKFQDQETGLINYGFRYYAPGLGRFINRDPIAEKGGLNLYGFCGNDGVNHWDYLGQSFFSKIGKFFKKYWKPILAAVAAIVTAGALAPWAAGFATGTLGLSGVAANIAAGAIVGGASGFVGGAIGAALNGGNLGQVLKAGLAGGALGAAVGGITNGIWGPNGTTLKANPKALLAANTDDLGELVRFGALKVTGSSVGTLSNVANTAIGAAGAASAAYGWNAATSRYDSNAPALQLPKYSVNGFNPIDRSSWSIGWQAALQGAMAYADGFNPFGDPFESAGQYNHLDDGLYFSQAAGMIGREAVVTVTGARALAWAGNFRQLRFLNSNRWLRFGDGKINGNMIPRVSIGNGPPASWNHWWF